MPRPVSGAGRFHDQPVFSIVALTGSLEMLHSLSGGHISRLASKLFVEYFPPHRTFVLKSQRRFLNLVSLNPDDRILDAYRATGELEDRRQ